MKLYVRILLSLLCAVLVLAMPFVLSAPDMLGSVKWEILGGSDDGGGGMFWLVPSAGAEETADEYALPWDFSPGMAPNPALYTDDGYEDDSIRVQMETREENGVIWRIAWVEIASPTQLRTAVVDGSMEKPGVALVKSMAESSKAVVAMNGDYFNNDPDKTSFEIRMGNVAPRKRYTNAQKDMLLIDDQGDFHLVFATPKKDQEAAITELMQNYQIMNAFTFGPALVHEGQVIKTSKNYGYNPNGKEPRSAIGQLDRLSYVLVIAEGRGASKGVTQQQLADFMGQLNCRTAFNLDGGGSATMVFRGEYYNKLGGSPRNMNDCIYFATAVSSQGEKE